MVASLDGVTYVRHVSDEDDLIPTQEVANILGVSPSTVLRMVNRDRSLTPAARAPGLRGALLFRRADVHAVAESHKATA